MTSACGTGRINHPVDHQPAVRQVKAREAVGAIAEDGDVQGFQPLECGPHVQDGFHARAHDGDRRMAKRGEIGGFVPRLAGFAVHAAEPAGGEYADAHAAGQKGRARHGGRPITAARRGGGQIPHAQLRNVGARGKTYQLVCAQANNRLAGDHAHRRRYAAFGTDDLLELVRQGQVVRLG